MTEFKSIRLNKFGMLVSVAMVTTLVSACDQKTSQSEASSAPVTKSLPSTSQDLKYVDTSDEVFELNKDEGVIISSKPNTSTSMSPKSESLKVDLAAPVLDQYVTVSGAVYKLVKNAPEEMQPAYEDTNGLVWGDVLKRSDGSLITASAGTNICASIKVGSNSARLPMLQEFLRLRDAMSKSPQSRMPDLNYRMSENYTYDLSKPALPNLGHVFPSASSVQGISSTWHGMFDGQSGMLSLDNAAFGYGCNDAFCSPIRCVIPKSYIEAGSNPVPEYVTIKGDKYTLEPDAPKEMGASYKDARGLIWGDLIRDEDGAPKVINQEDAEQVCGSISYKGRSARLPTGEELFRLRESMSQGSRGGLSADWNPGSGTWPDGYVLLPALPNMDLDANIWSSTRTGFKMTERMYLNTQKGNMHQEFYKILSVPAYYDYFPEKRFYARCVVDTSNPVTLPTQKPTPTSTPSPDACSSIDLRSAQVHVKCTTTQGSVFERVSRDNFGEAWRGPDGLIWSSRIGKSSQGKAIETCKTLGGELPTKNDFERGEASGFREVLPSMKDQLFWSSTIGEYSNEAYYFDGYLGNFDDSYLNNDKISVRCVAR